MRSKSAVMTFIRFPLKSTLMDRLDWTVHRETIGKSEKKAFSTVGPVNEFKKFEG